MRSTSAPRMLSSQATESSARDHRRVELLGLEPFGHVGALGRARLAGQRLVLDERRRGRRRRAGPATPRRSDWPRPRPARRRPPRAPCRPLSPSPRVCSHGSKPIRGAFGACAREPFGEAVLRHRLVLVEPAVDLVAHLQRVAAVDEHRRLVREHHRGPGRAAEPGQPGQPLGIAADVFAEVLVGDRDHEPVEPLPRQFLAQGVEPGFVGLHQHGCGPFAHLHRGGP